MTLLKRFVGEVAEQVNLLNGFVSGVSDNSLPVPSYFYLTFNSKGHEFEWGAVNFEGFDHYELRTNTNYGSAFGLLLNTIDIKCTIPLKNRSGTIYLYVVTSDGTHSNPVTLTYNKPFPIAPYDIAVTKTDEGTMIFFAPIPVDCIGANIYVNQVQFSSSTNSFLYTGSETIEDILISYYDSFGEGDFCDIYFDPPVVQNFIVERNDCYLDFRWDNVSLYNAKYVIRKSPTEQWEDGEVISEQYTNSFRYVFPNDGNFYFLIKAYDEHGNCSSTATWVSLLTVPDISRNIILVSKQSPDFSGSKVNLGFDDSNDSIVLNAGQFLGEYFSFVNLPQVFRARNWIDYNVYSYGDSGLTWDDFNYTWDSPRGDFSWSGELFDNVSIVKNEISMHVGMGEGFFEVVSFSDSLVTDSEVSPIDFTDVSYSPCYFANGVAVSPFVGVLYDLNVPIDFSCVFILRISSLDGSGSVLKFVGSNCFLELRYDILSNSFFLYDHLGNIIDVSVSIDPNDIIFVGVSEFSGTRKLFVKSKLTNSFDYNFLDIIGRKYNSLFIGNNVEVLS